MKPVASVSIASNWPQVKAISFDLDDTLWPIRPVIERAEQSLWNWLHQEFPRVTETHDVVSLREHRAKIGLDNPQLAHDLAGLRRHALEALLEEFGYAANTELARQQAIAGWQIFYAERNRIEWYDDALPALNRLQPHFVLAATTNGNADLSLIGADRFFQSQLHAGLVGAAKPDAPMWQALCDSLSLQPEQILHIGDHPEHDVLGALRHGHPAIWLNRSQHKWLQHGQQPDQIASLEQLLP